MQQVSGTSVPGKSRKKPNYIGLNNNKVKAGVADEPSLDSLRTQLETLEGEVISCAQSSMYVHVVNKLKNLKPYDFDN